jgi:hypothetical protein
MSQRKGLSLSSQTGDSIPSKIPIEKIFLESYTILVAASAIL